MDGMKVESYFVLCDFHAEMVGKIPALQSESLKIAFIDAPGKQVMHCWATGRGCRLEHVEGMLQAPGRAPIFKV